MKKRIKDGDYKVYLCIGLMLLLVLSMIYYYAVGNSSFSKYKKDKTKQFVYSVYKKGNTSVPNINIDSKDIDIINQTIIDKANNFLQGNNTITYTYEINGKIMSLAIQYTEYSTDTDYPKLTYDVYNINYQEGKQLTNEEILSLYDVNVNDIKNLVEAKFKEYYVDLYNKKYINSNKCDYICFLYLSGIPDERYMENINYYIINGNLYVIRPFNYYTYYDTEKYFSTKHFFIQITE